MKNQFNRALLRAICLAMLALFAPLSVLAGPNVWTPLGPDGGNATQILSHPSNGNILFAVAGGRIFRSDNAGGAWQLAMRGLPDARNSIRLEMAASDPDRLYALITADSATRSQGIFRSTNGGQRWQRLRYSIPVNTLLIDLSVDASTTPGTDKLALASLPGGLGSVVLSDDGGRTFRNPAPGSGYPSEITPFTISVARHGNAVFTLVSGGVIYRSLDNGATFSVYSGLPGGIGGMNRLRAAPSITGSIVTLLGFELSYPTTCAPSCPPGLRISNATGAATFSVLSSLSGATWIKPSSPSTLLMAYPEQIVSSINAGTSVTSLLTQSSGFFTDVAGQFDYPNAPQTLYYASATRGLARSSNNGATSTPSNTGLRAWPTSALALVATGSGNFRLYSGFNADQIGNNLAVRNLNSSGPTGAWTTLPVQTVGVAGVPVVSVDFVDPQRIYAGNSNGNLVRSINAGVGFSSVALTGLRDVGATALDPRSCVSPPPSGPCSTGFLQRVFIGGTENGAAALGANSGALQLSLNAGANFAAASGLPRPVVTNLALRVNSIAVHAGNPQIVYAGSELVGSGSVVGSNTGIFRSSNGGTSFTLSNSGLPPLPGAGSNTAYHVLSVRSAPSSGAIVYAGLTNGRVNPTALAGVYKSTDAGLTWRFSGLSKRVVRDFWISTSNPNRVYAAFTGSRSGPGGVARSLDAGASWQVISRGLPLAGASDIEGSNQELFAATPFGVYSFSDGVDDDSDNVDSATEGAAPNNGDLNFDGIPDRLQKTSASFVLQDSGDETTSTERGVINYGNEEDVTPALAPERVEGSGPGCGQLINAYGIDGSSLERDPHPTAAGTDYDNSLVGLVNIEINDCSFAIIDVFFNNGTFTDRASWRWRNFGPLGPGDDENVGWYTFAGATQLTDKKWRLTINANQVGVYRDDPRSILLRGGPSFFPDRLLRDGFQ